ncbi:MAG: nucleoside triphosphate pyrophosphohydrolase [Candidatus Pacebacteria bacterium]|nr:nucleoside triphosphate pyrophosphohydrolase [Candidatus Paceibacterota bacterium]MCF7857643.1 nucleoside triphosphate pyrophosphohydrolase [Candidatus Paceibacterota bacterium]
MEKIYYNKLCRDNVPDIIAAKGFECEVREVDHDEYKREIVRKVLEEASGVSNHLGKESLLKEIADLVITLDAVTKEFGITDEEIDQAVEKSIEEKGGYEDMLYLTWSADTEYTSHDHGRGLDD